MKEPILIIRVGSILYIIVSSTIFYLFADCLK